MSVRISGSASGTIVESSIITNRPAHPPASTHQRLLSSVIMRARARRGSGRLLEAALAPSLAERSANCRPHGIVAGEPLEAVGHARPDDRRKPELPGLLRASVGVAHVAKLS